MAVYFFISGIVQIILAALNLILFKKDSLDIFLISIIIFAIGFVLYPKYKEKLNKICKSILNGIFIAISIITNLLFVFLIIMIIVNLPKTGSYKSKFQIQVNPQSEEEAYIKYFNSIDSIDIESEEEREEFLEFISENIVSQPLNEFEGDFYGPSFEEPIPKLLNLKSIYSAELAEISSLLYEGNIVLAQNKYIRLWKISDNLFSGQNTLIHEMVSIVLANKLIDYYNIKSNILDLKNNEELTTYINDIINKIDESFKKSLILENSSVRFFLLNLKESHKYLTIANLPSSENLTFDRLIIYLYYEYGWSKLFYWPFFDYNETVKKFDEYYELGFNIIEKEYNECKNDLTLNQLTDKYKSSFVLKNPTGKEYFMPPNIIRIILKIKELKSRMEVLLYRVSLENNENIENFPFNDLSGNKFLVNYENIFIRIQGEKLDILYVNIDSMVILNDYEESDNFKKWKKNYDLNYYPIAIEYLIKGTDEGEVDAVNMLAICLLDSFEAYNIEKDESKAIELFLFAAQRGFADAQYNLANCFDHGNGVKKDIKKAGLLYQMAAMQGHKQAQFELIEQCLKQEFHYNSYESEFWGRIFEMNELETMIIK